MNSPTTSIAPGAVFSSTPPQAPQPVPPVAASNDENENASVEVASTVKLSGRAMMLARLFRTTDPKAEPAVATDVKPVDNDAKLYPYLERQDREVLAKAYDYATERGIDPSNVDAVARDLAVHRSSSISPDMLDGAVIDASGGGEKSAELARAVTAYRMMPGSPDSRERYYEHQTSRILQSHLASGGNVDFAFVRKLLTNPDK